MKKGYILVMAFLLAGLATSPAAAKVTKAEIEAEMAFYKAKIAAAKAREVAAGQRSAVARQEAVAAKATAAAAGKAAETARAKALTLGKIADEARDRQKAVLSVLTAIPGPGWIFGHFASWYKAGEMSYAEDHIGAVHTGGPKPAGNETGRGLSYAILKGLSTAPEGMALYGVGRTLGLLAYDQLDPYSVWTAYGRPYWLDSTVIGAKAFFGAGGAYAGNVGLWQLRPATEPIQNAFVWMAMGGGSWNVVSGTASQAFQGARPFQKYYDQHRWWSGCQPRK